MLHSKVEGHPCKPKQRPKERYQSCKENQRKGWEKEKTHLKTMKKRGYFKTLEKRGLHMKACNVLATNHLYVKVKFFPALKLLIGKGNSLPYVDLLLPNERLLLRHRASLTCLQRLNMSQEGFAWLAAVNAWIECDHKLKGKLITKGWQLNICNNAPKS